MRYLSQHPQQLCAWPPGQSLKAAAEDNQTERQNTKSLLALLMSNTGRTLPGAKLMLADISSAGSAYPRQLLSFGIEAALPYLQDAGHARHWHQFHLRAVSGTQRD